ncbi:MAG: ABC transporter ATP-binding protein [Acidimicrobiia bacterium]|nr:ABC transporter ATP-binding protein [Acidimicrobiia bacterium]
MALLEVDGVGLEFGGIRALDDLEFTVEAGEICALIGPNGAGKTTLFNCVSRVYTPQRGSIRFDGRELLTLPPHRVARAGVGRTFQNLALFPALTVLQNVMVGAYSRGRGGAWSDALRLPGVARRERRLAREGSELLERLSLDHLGDQPASDLPYGTLKRIEIARALASQPRLLLLDEPAAGLTHSEVEELGGTIRQIRDDFELTVLLVEHHMPLVMSISDRVVVLDLGRKLAEGTADAVSQDPQVIAAYLGAEL